MWWRPMFYTIILSRVIFAVHQPKDFASTSGTKHEICPVIEQTQIDIPSCSGTKDDEDGPEDNFRTGDREDDFHRWNCVGITVKRVKVLMGYDTEETCNAQCGVERLEAQQILSKAPSQVSFCTAGFSYKHCHNHKGRLVSAADQDPAIPHRFRTMEYLFDVCTRAFPQGESTSVYLDNAFTVSGKVRDPVHQVFKIVYKTARSICQTVIQGKNRAKIASESNTVNGACFCFISSFYPAIYSVNQTGFHTISDQRDPVSVVNRVDEDDSTPDTLLQTCGYKKFVNYHVFDEWQLHGTYVNDELWGSHPYNKPERCSVLEAPPCPSAHAGDHRILPDVAVEFPPRQ